MQENHHRQALLLQGGAAVDQKTEHGDTPLFVACHAGQESCARLLLQAQAAVNLVSSEGFSPLHLACYSGQESCIRVLLEARAKPARLVQQHVQRAHADHGREAHHGVAVAHARGISPRWPHRTRPIGASRVWSVFHPLNLAVTPSE